MAITPLFSPGYFYDAHDGRHSVFYLIQFDASIRDGIIWPRWAMHHTQGYGYPTFIIQAPLGFYLAEVFILLGAGYTQAAKLSWAVGSMAGGLGIYHLMMTMLRYPARLSSTQPSIEQNHSLLHPTKPDPEVDVGKLRLLQLIALTSGLLYVFIPYHFVGMYVRAALNDTLLMGWFPWVFLTFENLIRGGMHVGWPRRLAIAALSLGGVLLTHAFALISFTPLLLSFILFRLGFLRWNRQTWQLTIRTALLTVGAGLGALLLYANFLIPLLLEGSPYLQQQVYVTETYDFRRHFVYWGQFLNPFWGFGFSDDPNGAGDGMGFQVGALTILMAIAALYLHRQNIHQQRMGHRNVEIENECLHWSAYLPMAFSFYLIIITLALLLLMTPLSAPLWESITLLAVIQFPWRLLALASFTSCVLAGLTMWHFCQYVYPESSPIIIRRELDNTDSSGRIIPRDSLAAMTMIGLLGIFGSYGYIQANLAPVEAWREDGRAIVFFEREHPDMMGYTKWVDGIIHESPMTANYLDDAYFEDYTERGILDRLLIVEGSGEVVSRYSRGSTFGGVVHLDESSTVRVLVYHFPGWQVVVNEVPVDYSISTPEGLIEIALPAGQHKIEAELKSTGVRRLSAFLSGVTLMMLVGMLLASNGRYGFSQ